MPIKEQVKYVGGTLQKSHFFVFMGFAFLSRLVFAIKAQYPGHADYAFYYTVAENIAEGRGFVVDYIWTYLSNPQTITHSSNDYWMPFTGIIISLSFVLLGKSLFTALLPSIFAGLSLSIVTLSFSKIYSKSEFVATSASSLILFVPLLFNYSLLTDSAIYYALLSVNRVKTPAFRQAVFNPSMVFVVKYGNELPKNCAFCL